MIYSKDLYWFHGQNYLDEYDPKKSTYHDYNQTVYFLSDSFLYSALTYAVKHFFIDGDFFGKVLVYKNTRPLKIFSINNSDDMAFAKANGFEDVEDIYIDYLDRWNKDFIDFIWNKTDYDGVIHTEMEIRYRENTPCGLGIRVEVLDSAFEKTIEYNSREECLTRPEYKKVHDIALDALFSEMEKFKNKNPSKEEINEGIIDTIYNYRPFSSYNKNFAIGIPTLYFSKVYKILHDNFNNADWDMIDKKIETSKKMA